MGQYCGYCPEWSIGFCLECGNDFCEKHEVKHADVCTRVNNRAVENFNKEVKQKIE